MSSRRGAFSWPRRAFPPLATDPDREPVVGELTLEGLLIYPD
jgi:hypothetical protein